jgi:hypothetical protein
MNNYKFVWDKRLIEAMLQQLIIALFIGFLIHIVIRVAFNVPADWTWMAYMIGAAIWTCIICFTSVANLWFICPEANRIVVLANPLKARRVITGDDLTSLQDTRNMRAIIGPTFAGISIFESVVCIIDTSRSMPLGETPVVAYTKNGVKVTVGFQAFLTAIPSEEAAVNLARHNIAYIKARFMNAFRSYIVATIVTMTDRELLTAIYDHPENETRKVTGTDLLKHGFSNLFGGPNQITEIELQHGVFTGSPAIGDVIIDADYQQAKQAVPSARKTAQAIKLLVATGMDPDVAANMVAASNKQALPAQVKKYAGLAGVRHFVAGDVSR